MLFSVFFVIPTSQTFWTGLLTMTSSSSPSTTWLFQHSYDTRYQMLLVTVLTLLCFITVAPFAWVVLTSVKPNVEIYTTSLQILPQQPTLEHFQRVIEKGNQLPSYIL